MENKTERKFRITPALIILLLVAAYFIMLLRADWVVFSFLAQKKSKLEVDIASATGKKEKLKKEISALDDPQYIELVAREKLGLIRPGETAYKVVR